MTLITAPVVTITEISRTKISNKDGLDSCDVSFNANQDLVDWEARADGADVGQGLLVGRAAEPRYNWDKFDALGWTWDALDAKNLTWDDFAVVLKQDTTESFTVDDEELTSGEKVYRINIYGRNIAGEWTPYG